MKASTVWTAWAGAGAACLVLAVVVVGLPGTLIFAGGWLLAAGLGRTVPGLAGAASWAAAILLEVGLLSGLSAAVAFISPGPSARITDILVLAIPAVIGAVLWSLAFWGAENRHLAPPGVLGGLALAVSIVAFGAARWIASLGRDYGVAWAMSGDARNEVFEIRSVLQNGGLTVRELRAYPAIVDNLMALITVAGKRAGLRPGNLLLHDAQAMAAMYILAGIAVALMLAATLAELVPGAPAASLNNLPPRTLVVILAGAITAASPLVLGQGLTGGFVDAYARRCRS